MDIFEQIYGYAYKSICNITIGWPVKLVGGAVLLIVARHAALLTAFSLLVALDLFGDNDPSLLDSIKAIPEAHRQRIINSHEMKTQFIGKMIVYILTVIAAALVDFMIGHLNFSQIVIAYLASTELLSIIENLDDAGVSAVHDLVGLIKRKRA